MEEEKVNGVGWRKSRNSKQKKEKGDYSPHKSKEDHSASGGKTTRFLLAAHPKLTGYLNILLHVEIVANVVEIYPMWSMSGQG